MFHRVAHYFATVVTLLSLSSCALPEPPPVSVPEPSPTASTSYDDGLTAYNRGDFATALHFWRPLAESGNLEAQYSLGLMYAEGQGIPQDYAKTVRWYRNAAEQGNAIAQKFLGTMYDTGQGVRQNYILAVRWYSKAAEQGNGGCPGRC